MSSAKQKVPLVLLHGFPFDKKNWDKVIPYISHCFEVYRPEFRGLGNDKGSTQGLTLSILADDIFGFLTKNKINSAVVAGFSLGGYALFELLNKAPNLISHAVFLACRPQADTDQAQSLRNEQIDKIFSGNRLVYQREYLDALFSIDVPSESINDRKAYERVMSQVSDSVLIDYIRAFRDRRDFHSLKWEAPTSVILSAKDNVIPFADASSLLNHKNLFQSTVLDAGGHMVLDHSPFEVAKALIQVAEEVTRGH